MRKKVFLLVMIFFVISNAESLEEVQKRIIRNRLNWKAGTTSLSNKTKEQLQAMLIPDSESIGELKPCPNPIQFFLKKQAAIPDDFDWRPLGKVTPVKDQNGCGICGAFAICAALESAIWIHNNIELDLSEQHLAYCAGGSCSGVSPGRAIEYAVSDGIPDEACHPFTSGTDACSNSCSDWQQRAWKIYNWGKTSSQDEMKSRITDFPIIDYFIVYDDFQRYYTSGIYKWDGTSAALGYHAVCVVGYSTSGTEKYWICKNSWGTSWGEDVNGNPNNGSNGGYFRIQFGQCNIDDSEWWISDPVQASYAPNNYFGRNIGGKR